MNWFQQNRFLGIFIGGLAFAALLSVSFLFHEKSAANREQARLETTINELTRLRRSTPFPSEENFRRAKAQSDNYHDLLFALKNELKTRTFPQPPLPPNEFQAQLRQVATDVIRERRFPLTFFDPGNVQTKASEVFLYTVDVSDVIPVSIGRVRNWSAY